MHYLKPDQSPKWMSSWVGLVYFESLVGLRLLPSGLSNELGVNGEKKVSGIWDIIKLLIKMDITHFTLVNLEVLTV